MARQAGVGIKITPEMIKAGVDEFLSLDEDGQHDDPRDVVTWIFSAMIEARGQVHSQKSR